MNESAEKNIVLRRSVFNRFWGVPMKWRWAALRTLKLHRRQKAQVAAKRYTNYVENRDKNNDIKDINNNDNDKNSSYGRTTDARLLQPAGAPKRESDKNIDDDDDDETESLKKVPKPFRKFHLFFKRYSKYKKPLSAPGMVILIIIYAVIGGAIYYALEHEAEIKLNEEKIAETAATKQNIADMIRKNSQNSICPSGQLPILKESSAGVTADQIMSTLDLNATPDYYWSFSGSVWFAITIFTTIGYGNYAPNTVGGRVFTIFYALFGIPIMLITLNEVGGAFTRLLKYLLNSVYRAIHGARMKYRRKKLSRQMRKDTDLPTDDFFEPYVEKEMDQFNFGIIISIFLLLSYILIVSAVTHAAGAFDGGSYFTSIYYWFITISTIGLGDFTIANTDYTIITFPVFIVGLALLAMVLTVIQIQMDELEVVNPFTGSVHVGQESGMWWPPAQNIFG